MADRNIGAVIDQMINEMTGIFTRGMVDVMFCMEDTVNFRLKYFIERLKDLAESFKYSAPECTEYNWHRFADLINEFCPFGNCNHWQARAASIFTDKVVEEKTDHSSEAPKV